jgi:hypothetical protein
LGTSLHARKAFIYWGSRISVKGGTFFSKSSFPCLLNEWQAGKEGYFLIVVSDF